MRTVPCESFAALLRGHRQAVGLSQEELSARSGLSVRAIGFMEAGRTSRPYLRSVRLLIDALALADPEAAALLRAAGRSGPPTSARRAHPAVLPPDIAEVTGRPDLPVAVRVAAARSFLAGALAQSADLGLPETAQIAAAIAALGQED